MDWLPAVIFLFGLIAVVYPYIIYPGMISVLARLHSAAPPAPEPPPARVAILVSAYNEQANIAAKIENFLALDYPEHLLELRIGDDGSSDATSAVVRSYADDRIKLLSLKARSGKTSVLNRLVAMGPADLLVFTDVNCEFRPDAVRQLARAFADDRVGLVSGRTVVTGEPGSAEGFYTKFEQRLKSKESRLGWLCGADGAIYMLRGSLYEPLDPGLINDFTHTWQVLLRGYKAKMEPQAICEEPPGGSAAREVKRQRRMVSQSLFVVRSYAGKLVSRGLWGPVWVLLSHKASRWAAGAGLVLMLGSGGYMLAKAQPWYLLAIPTAAGLSWAMLRTGGRLQRLAAAGLWFLAVHGAYLLGVLDYLRGNRYVTWAPRGG